MGAGCRSTLSPAECDLAIGQPSPDPLQANHLRQMEVYNTAECTSDSVGPGHIGVLLLSSWTFCILSLVR